MARSTENPAPGVVTFTRAAGRLAQRSQSGRIADYYAAGAVITVALVVLLIVVR